MDFLAILQDHLDFIERFYAAASEPFQTTLRKIEAGEEPFIPDPESKDYPPFELEWREAYQCLGVLGNCGLGLLEKALHDYLREFVRREGGPGPKRQGESWFDLHCRFLVENTPFRWENSPVSIDRIEQINLARNDISHGFAIDNVRPKQSERHFRRYPISRFADEWEVQVFSKEDGMESEFPLTINITREKLAAAVDDARQFSKFVEA
jgi:hypothetical protein